MGYYTRSDLPFFHALADAFTICDGYHCSVIGPTDPNRLYSMTGTIDPAGVSGGPILSTSSTRVARLGSLTWTTTPEQLNTRSVSWKVYAGPDANYGDNVLPYFRNYQVDAALAANAFTPTFPGTFEADCSAGTLPQASWILAPLIQSEHPPAPVTYGEVAATQVLDALVSNPDSWRRPRSSSRTTRTAASSTTCHRRSRPGERRASGSRWIHCRATPPASRAPSAWASASPSWSCRRTPAAASCDSNTFDHTSLLRFLETRFGTEVPNLSAWRRSVTGDLTAAFDFVAPNTSVPSLP